MQVNVEDGITVITGANEELLKFPKLIELVEQNGYGVAQGALKIRLDPLSTRQTSLENLLKRLKLDEREPGAQLFFRSTSSDTVYGYKHAPCRKAEMRAHHRTVTKPSSYSHTTCCSEKLNTEGKEALLKHFWTAIESHSYPASGSKRKAAFIDDIDSLMKQGAKVREKYDLHLNSLGSSSKEDMNVAPQVDDWNGTVLPLLGTHCACEVCNDDDCEIEENVMRCKRLKERILYGAGFMVEKGSIEIVPNFTLSKLNTILDVLPIKHHGLSNPYFYNGTTHSTFVAHIEDAALWSINFIHYGHCKVWFIVPPKYCGLVDYYLSKVHLSMSQVTCRNVLGHKHVLLTEDFLRKYSIPYSVVIQEAGEFVITFPNAVHFGFNMGCNIAEAANFASVSWIPLGMAAPRCCCFDDQIHLDMTPLLAAFRPDLLRDYLEGNLISSPDEHPMAISLAPSSTGCEQSDVLQNNSAVGGQQLEVGKVHGDCSDEEEDDDLVTSEERQKKGRRVILECPACDTSYKGGKGRIGRLVKHVHKHHQTQLESVLRTIEEKYPKRNENENKKHTCPQCHKLFAGSSFHLKDHMKRVHNL